MRPDKAVVRYANQGTFNQMQDNLTASPAKLVVIVMLLTLVVVDIRRVQLVRTTLSKARVMIQHVSSVLRVHSALRQDRTAVRHVSHVLLGLIVTRLVRRNAINVIRDLIHRKVVQSARYVQEAFMLIRKVCLAASNVPTVWTPRKGWKSAPFVVTTFT